MLLLLFLFLLPTVDDDVLCVVVEHVRRVLPEDSPAAPREPAAGHAGKPNIEKSAKWV